MMLELADNELLTFGIEELQLAINRRNEEMVIKLVQKIIEVDNAWGYRLLELIVEDNANDQFLLFIYDNRPCVLHDIARERFNIDSLESEDQEDQEDQDDEEIIDETDYDSDDEDDNWGIDSPDGEVEIEDVSDEEDTAEEASVTVSRAIQVSKKGNQPKKKKGK